MFNMRLLRIKAMQQLLSDFFQKKINPCEESSSDFKVKNKLIINDIEAIRGLHSSFLQLFISWLNIGQERYLRLKNKPKTDFYNNSSLIKLSNDARLKKIKATYPICWREDLQKRWYKDYIQDYPPLNSVNREPPSSEHKQHPLIKRLVKYIFKIEEIQQYASLEDIRWSENRALLHSLLLEFCVKFLENDESAFYCYNTFMNPTKISFYEMLILKASTHSDENEQRIAKYLHNWQLKRISNIDLLLIKMALVEIEHMPNIPFKVTLNEYMEIAKKYSSAKSPSFINGIVDKIIKDEELIKN